MARYLEIDVKHDACMTSSTTSSHVCQVSPDVQCRQRQRRTSSGQRIFFRNLSFRVFWVTEGELETAFAWIVHGGHRRGTSLQEERHHQWGTNEELAHQSAVCTNGEFTCQCSTRKLFLCFANRLEQGKNGSAWVDRPLGNECKLLVQGLVKMHLSLAQTDFMMTNKLPVSVWLGISQKLVPPYSLVTVWYLLNTKRSQVLSSKLRTLQPAAMSRSLLGKRTGPILSSVAVLLSKSLQMALVFIYLFKTMCIITSSSSF